MIDSVKNNKTSHYIKWTLLFIVPFLTACQSFLEKTETVASETIAPKAIDPKAIAPENIQQTKVSNPQRAAEKKSAKADYSQSRPPMSVETKKRLKANAQELISNGVLPKINYQQPAPPKASVKQSDSPGNKPQEPLRFDYEQVEIRQILEDFSDALNMTIVIDPTVSGAVTMRTAPNSTLTNKDLWPLLQMILSEAGVLLEQHNGIYYARNSPNFLPSVIGTNKLLANTDASLVAQITPLTHISLDSAKTVLGTVIGPKGRMIPVEHLNTLLIIDKPERLQRINGLLSLIDSDPFKNRGIHLYKIKAAEAKNVATELQEILKLIEGNKPVYQVMALERINALLVVAPPGRGFKEVGRWVDILDAGADEELLEQIFVYKCKSMTATSLATTLNAIFEQDDKTPKKQQPEKVDNPNEYKTVSKESLSFEAAVKRKVNNKQPAKTTKSVTKSSTSQEASSANLKVTIVADEETNALLVRTTARDYKQLLGTIRTLDVVPLQVLVNVVIAQVELSDSQKFGIDWSYLGSSGTLLQTNFQQAQVLSDKVEPLGLIVNRLTGDWRVTLNALATESDVTVLSRPSLLITNNQEGMINVGKEVPVETSNTTYANTSSTTTTTDGTTTNSPNVTSQIAYRKTGIELTVTPQINEDGMVNMSIEQGLSGIGANDNTLQPTFTNQEISTSIVVKDGETIILGGLIESTENEGENGVPILKDIPLMGNLFKKQSTEIKRSELILIISTNLVNAEGNYDDFNTAFKSRYHAAASYLDRQLADDYYKRTKKGKTKK